MSGLCLTQLDSISLSQKVDLHSLLDLICPSMINKYLAAYLFTWSYMLVDLHTISEEIWNIPSDRTAWNTKEMWWHDNNLTKI